MKCKDYMVVSDSNVHDFNSRLEIWIDKGYEPVGNVVVTPWSPQFGEDQQLEYTQALIKTEN